MNRKQAKKILPVIQAFAEGKTIEQKDGFGNWIIIADPEFRCPAYTYRIKHELKYRPFKDVEECWAEMQKHSPFGWVKNSYGYFEVTGLKKEGICFGVANNFHGYEYLCTDYLFADGTPFGIKEENNNK